MAARKTHSLTMGILSFLAIVAMGCSGAKSEDAKIPVPDVARKFCDSSLTPSAVRAFGRLLAERNIEEPKSSGKLEKAANSVKQVPRDDLVACEVIAHDSADYGMDIRFGWSYGLVPPSRKDGDVSFSVADQAFSNENLAYILLKCGAHVPKLDADKKHYLLARLTGPDSDLPVAERRKLHISILYPLLRKMAGIMGCKEAAALPATPSIKTTTPPK